MKTIRKLKYLIIFYLGSLVFLLMAVIAVPLAIQHGVTLTRAFIIEEDIIETTLIAVLFIVSFFALRTFNRTLYAYERAVNLAGEEKSGLVSQMKAAFRYIGIVNAELHEIQSILCGSEHYPRTKKEFKLLIDNLAVKAMTIARAPWIVIRILRRCDGQTINEYAVARPGKAVPSVTMGNKTILEGGDVGGLIKVGSCRKNLDILTVGILPAMGLSAEETLLITAIVNQIEIHFLLHQSGFLEHQSLKSKVA